MSLTPEIIRHLETAIVTVIGPGGTGGGFYVKCGSIITSAGIVSKGPVYVQVKSYVYAATIQALDPVSDIAIIDLDTKIPWNADLPTIKSTYLRFSPSRCILLGSPAYSYDSTGLKQGWIQNNRNVTSGVEVVTTNIQTMPGFPLLDITGRVIALSSGLAQQMAEPIIRSLLKPDIHIQMVDGIKSYTRGSLGVKMAPLTAADLIQVPNSKFKQVTGWIITETPTESKWQKGDLVLSLNDVLVGLVPPSLILWNSLPGMSMKVIWRAYADAYATCHETVVTLQ
jgi:hypothetical protein